MISDKQESRRSRIIDKARAIISAHGADGLSMKELGRQADVPRASLYRIYDNKEHVISDLTLEWGMSLAQRLHGETAGGRSNGERIAHVLKSILQEAENNPLLIGAVLDHLLAANDSSRNRQRQFEALLPALLDSAVDLQTIPDTARVMDVLLRLLLGNLQVMSSGRSTLDESLDNMTFAAEKLVGEKYWAARPGG